MENVINELSKAGDKFYDECMQDFGGVLKCNYTGFHYDHAHTSYSCNFNLMGWECQVVYVFSEDTIYVYDIESDIDRIAYDNAHNQVTGIGLIFEFVLKYACLYHFCEGELGLQLK